MAPLPEGPKGEKQVSLWERLKRWLQAHHLTLMTLPDTPHSIALGSAIGMFFGFTPLFGLKTLLSLALAWLFKGNKIAAFISVTLHDIILPFWPAIARPRCSRLHHRQNRGLSFQLRLQ